MFFEEVRDDTAIILPPDGCVDTDTSRVIIKGSGPCNKRI